MGRHWEVHEGSISASLGSMEVSAAICNEEASKSGNVGISLGILEHTVRTHHTNQKKTINELKEDSTMMMVDVDV